MKGTARIASLLSGAALAAGLLLGAAPVAHADGRHGDGHQDGRDRASVDTRDWPQGKSLSNPDGGDWDKPGFLGGTSDDRDGNNGCGNDDDRDDDNNGNCGRVDGAAGVQGDREEKCRVEAADEADEDDAKDEADHHEAKDEADHDDADDHSRDEAKADDDDDDDDAVVAAAEAEADDDNECPDTTVAAAGTATSPGTKVEAGVSAASIPSAAGTTVLGATEVAPDTTTTTTAPGTQVLGITETAPDTLARTGAGVAGLAALGGLCLGGGRLFSLVRRLLGS